jgi:hypothetical protein
MNMPSSPDTSFLNDQAPQVAALQTPLPQPPYNPMSASPSQMPTPPELPVQPQAPASSQPLPLPQAQPYNPGVLPQASVPGSAQNPVQTPDMMPQTDSFESPTLAQAPETEPLLPVPDDSELWSAPDTSEPLSSPGASSRLVITAPEAAYNGVVSPTQHPETAVPEETPSEGTLTMTLPPAPAPLSQGETGGQPETSGMENAPSLAQVNPLYPTAQWPGRADIEVPSPAEQPGQFASPQTNQSVAPQGLPLAQVPQTGSSVTVPPQADSALGTPSAGSAAVNLPQPGSPAAPGTVTVEVTTTTTTTPNETAAAEQPLPQPSLGSSTKEAKKEAPLPEPAKPSAQLAAPQEKPQSVESPAPAAKNSENWKLPTIKSLNKDSYYVQLAASKDRSVLEKDAGQFNDGYPFAVQSVPDKPYRLLLGPLNEGESNAVLARVSIEGYSDAFIRGAAE